MKRTYRTIMIAGMALLVVAGCTNGPSVSPVDLAESPPLSPLPREGATITPGLHRSLGRIVNRASLTNLAQRLSGSASLAVRASYRSAGGHSGKPAVVSGSFFIPKGTPPNHGWPVVSFAHGTTGIEPGCGLSESHDLRGFASSIKGFLHSGYAVAATDYTGLGQLGQPSATPEHVYLEPETAAHDVIDAVRALRQLSPQVSGRWIAVGNSQGGQAAWAAAEQNSTYGQGLAMVGAATIAPAADISQIAALAQAGQLSPSQIHLLPMIAVGLKRAYDFESAHVLSGPAANPAALGCGPAASQAQGFIRGTDVTPITDGNTASFRDLLRANALPQRRLSVPLLVVNGGKDDVVLPAWTETAVRRACALGGVVTHTVVPSAGHADISPTANFQQWMTDRFAGRQAVSNCPGSSR